jgi:hypothetical protein
VWETFFSLILPFWLVASKFYQKEPSLLAATLYQGNIYPLAKLGKGNSNLASTILKQLAKMAR